LAAELPLLATPCHAGKEPQLHTSISPAKPLGAYASVCVILGANNLPYRWLSQVHSGQLPAQFSHVAAPTQLE
jgi:hypothetical protein